MSDEFEAAVGMSRKWDAREAGREVAQSTLDQLSHPPKFFLLFSTIHYEKHGGFQEFLNGVWEVLPEGTPLVGGTVAGFINPKGCYTRGCSALAGYYTNMDIVVGVGKDTKRSPKSAAKKCVDKLQKGLENSPHPNHFIFDIISGGLVPQIAGLGRKKVIRGMSSKVAVNLSNFSLTVLQKGVGREEEILNEVSKEFKECYILHGSSMDDGKAISNYQFINKKVDTNLIVAMGFAIDLDMDISSHHNLQEVQQFQVTKKSKDGRIIHEINNKPATEEFLRLLNWPEEYFDERLFKRTFFYPLGYKQGDKWIPEIVGIIAGNSINVLHSVKNNNMGILSASGRNLMSAARQSLEEVHPKNAYMGLISTCDGRLEALGYNIFKVHEEIKKQLGDTPFLALYCGGEGAKKPNESMYYGNVTFNTFVISRNKHQQFQMT